ncbi:1-deoxy-D-xylulose-5-phosphate synthase N-terminal domain-containing protein [Streptomyces sp. NPDC007205]|uniref:1-deoxy-D-xylulose-5-phosphate synthase N-terminal domain-containing protein n=1 Tax=Streptomyces sp. NPDC007205 TaxID=3154316 RepID=UPI0033E165BF
MRKLLTGRGNEFTSLRQAGGMSGYPSHTESVHDLVESSHASTALVSTPKTVQTRSRP